MSRLISPERAAQIQAERLEVACRRADDAAQWDGLADRIEVRTDRTGWARLRHGCGCWVGGLSEARQYAREHGAAAVVTDRRILVLWAGIGGIRQRTIDVEGKSIKTSWKTAVREEVRS